MIHIEKLDFAYKKAKIFNNLSLHLEKGNIYGLLGRNGAGKTTLLKLVSGLLFPLSGGIMTCGFTPRKREPDFLKEIFFLPEEYTLPGLKIPDYKRIHTPFYPDFDTEKFDECIEEFHLPLDRKLNAFSYGQKKKFLISFGIACNSRVFLLDEPTNGLDIPSKTQFRRIISSAGSENRIIIISTHQVRDMENLIDPIVMIENGQVILNQNLETIEKNLTIKRSQEKPSEEDLIYLEKVINGFTTVTTGKNELSGEMDLEILFNAVLANPEKIQAIFKGEKQNEHE